jgi:hypothetical protein
MVESTSQTFATKRVAAGSGDRIEHDVVADLTINLFLRGIKQLQQQGLIRLLGSIVFLGQVCVGDLSLVSKNAGTGEIVCSDQTSTRHGPASWAVLVQVDGCYGAQNLVLFQDLFHVCFSTASYFDVSTDEFSDGFHEL